MKGIFNSSNCCNLQTLGIFLEANYKMKLKVQQWVLSGLGAFVVALVVKDSFSALPSVVL